jgi:UDP-N-acetylmuramoyl-tripeptide--D-alanyl-D-alanine ligase
VIAVTGSVGKTTTKEMLRCVCRGRAAPMPPRPAINNHWGVPLTLARMPADTQFAVIEIGMNHPGEIAPLARWRAPCGGWSPPWPPPIWRLSA